MPTETLWYIFGYACGATLGAIITLGLRRPK